MEKIVDGILLEGKRRDDAWEVSAWTCGGHREVSVRAAIEWREVGLVPVKNWGAHPLGELDPVADADLIEEKRLRSLKKAAQRATTQCRRIIKAHSLDELLTLTYRENMTDEALTKKHKKEWARRMSAALGGQFVHCGAKEKQERGAWHWHIACHKLPKHVIHKGVKIPAWRLGTEIWRSVVGEDNGLCFVGGRPQKTRWGKARVPRSVAKIAAYVSKYITKDYDKCAKGSNRYSRSDVLDPGKVDRITLVGVSLAEVIGRVAEFFDESVSVIAHRLNAFHDSYWFATEPRPPERGRALCSSGEVG